jgi:O-antigen ligase
VTHGEASAHARRAGGFAIAALGLAIPVSTAADSVLLAVLLAAWLIAAPGSLREARTSILGTPPVTAAMLLFAALLIGCLYGDATAKESMSGLRKYLDLALVPVLAWGVAGDETRKRALVCFAIAVILSLYVSYSAAAGLPGLRSIQYPIGFKASVTHNLIVSLGAFLFLLAARETADRRWRIALVALAALCAYNVLFIVIGRSGYVVLTVLLAYFAVVTLRGWRGPLLAIVGCVALLSATYVASSSFRERVDEVASDLTRWKPGAADKTSVGQRIGYYRTTLEIAAEHPFIGVGTGGFARAYAEKVKGTAAPATTNPHNDYLLLAAQVGIPGVVLLLALYVAVWMSARRLESRLYRDLARGLVLTLAIAGLFNSVQLDHTEGFLFAWMTALLFASYRNPQRVRPS